MGRHEKSTGRKRLRFGRLRSVLAAGLVLGIGSAVTYAAWVDNEYAQSTFTASIFNTQSSVDGSVNWADNSISPGPTMTFNGSGMSPGSYRYAPFAIRSSAQSIAGTATLQAKPTDNTAMASELEYRVVLYSGTCSSNTFSTGTPTFVVGNGLMWQSLDPVGPAFGPVPIAANQASATQLCFEVRMKTTAPTTLQGQSVKAVWQLIATSSS